MNTLQIIYPDDMLHLSQPDETFSAEYALACQHNIHCVLLSSEAAAYGEYHFSSPLIENIPVLWRGWMLRQDEYEGLSRAVIKKGTQMVTSTDSYLRCHHLPGWYPQCQDLTPDTIITHADADFDALTTASQWPAWFVKDYVKSLTTSRGSIAHNAQEIREIIGLLKQYRGEIEGGICLRRVESFDSASEQRFFVLDGHVYGPQDTIPEKIIEIAARISSPFFSIDVIYNDNGELRLVEIGDGQVSDIKEWSPARFIRMLSAFRRA
ncbi:hypothetical protein CHU32_08885 [Superficieibacter electus]|uniref:ATP-grasp domain-containing protein n=1 Tax=Superficieibacter electus TaxID=2022662 RepID=A0A2P5GRQ6_9ENTR|nr:ATP-grasp domain-containing protein [Superficieibacter electus]POP45907.1 hypothetical protein CHU33_07340 [Superficieibacter electus]POP49214.1 hypothetical protein CHU32_08885 [Superficieibacter electus]